MSIDASSNYHQRLHALDVTTGAELLGGPIEICAAYPASGGVATLVQSPGNYEERAALLLLERNDLYELDFALRHAPYSGWIISLYAEHAGAHHGISTSRPTAVRGTRHLDERRRPGGRCRGNIYLLTANGAFETTMDANGFPSLKDYGNSFLKISTAAPA